jgi:hypothetical protein
LPAALAVDDRRYEGSFHRPNRAFHRALVVAATEEEAIDLVRDALQSVEEPFSEFSASPVKDAQGEVKHAPIRTRWDEVDWENVATKATLSELQRNVLWVLADAGEATWKVAQDPDVLGDRANVEAALSDLEARTLVYCVLEEGGEPGRESELDRWWAITDEGWDLLGLIKSPRYH